MARRWVSTMRPLVGNGGFCSRRRNAAADLTGLLLHVVTDEGDSAYFVQILEGEQSAVERAYARIEKDELHSDLQVLSSGPVASRTFENWDMRLEEISATELRQRLPGTGNLAGLVRDATAMNGLLRRYADLVS